MIFPLGKDLQPWVDFLSLPINDNDIIIVVRNSDLSKPLAVRWKDLKTALVLTGAISVSDDGTVVVNQAANINFVGEGVTVTANGSSATVTIPGGGGTSIQLQTNGVTNPVQNLLNLVEGTNVTITDDGSGNITIDASALIGGSPTQILYKDALNNVTGDANAVRTALFTLIKNENTGLGQYGQILILPTTAALTVEESGDDHISNVGIFGGLGANAILISQRNFANTESAQIRLNKDRIEFSGLVASVAFSYRFPLASPASGQVLGYVAPNQLGWITPSGSGTVTSVALAVPSPTNPAFTVSGSPVTSSGTLTINAAGTTGQYVRGDGSLANFPTSVGGGASLNYYLNGSINQGTFGGNAYYEMNRTPIIGSGTDFSTGTDGVIARFITDANDPSQLNIPAGNWLFDLYFSASSGGGSPTFYVSVFKYDGVSFTLIADSSLNPTGITNGTAVDIYVAAVAMPATSLAVTDRIAVTINVVTSGRTITLHTEDNNLCEVITTFTTGITALNGLTAQVQAFATGTSGTDFAISSSVSTHTFNLPTASASNRGALSSSDWSRFDSFKFTQITTILDGLGGVIQTGRGNNFLSIPFSGNITGWTILSSVTGSIEVAFWKDTYANYPPTVADNVFSPNPSLSAANKNQATGLSIPVTAGDIIIPNVVSVATCTNVTIAIQITRT